MPKIYKKIVHACGHCPKFDSVPIYGLNGCIEGVDNRCGLMYQIVDEPGYIPDWCPLPDGEE